MATQGYYHILIKGSNLHDHCLIVWKVERARVEMNKLSIQENEDKHVRKIALKAAENKNCQHSSDDSE